MYAHATVLINCIEHAHTAVSHAPCQFVMRALSCLADDAPHFCGFTRFFFDTSYGLISRDAAATVW